MYCIKCGAQIEDDATFCTSCGAPIESSSAAPTGTLGSVAAEPVAVEPAPAPAPTPTTPAAPAPTAVSASTSPSPAAQVANPQNKSLKIVAIALAIVAVIAVVVVGIMLVQQKEAQNAEAARFAAAEEQAAADRAAAEQAEAERIAEQQRTFEDDLIALKVPESWAGHWTQENHVTHSVNGGRIPNAWEYTFTNTDGSGQSFRVFLQQHGSYIGDTSRWIEVHCPDPSATCYIQGTGLDRSTIAAIVDSIQVKLKS